MGLVGMTGWDYMVGMRFGVGFRVFIDQARVQFTNYRSHFGPIFLSKYGKKLNSI